MCYLPPHLGYLVLVTSIRARAITCGQGDMTRIADQSNERVDHGKNQSVFVIGIR